MLLSNGADVNSTGGLAGGASALYYAAGAGHADVAGVLLDGGADPNMGVGHVSSWKPLHEAAYYNNWQVMKVLLSGGADPNIHTTRPGWRGGVPLHYVFDGTWSGAALAVSVLLDGGADVNALDSYGRSALDLAAGWYSSAAVAEILRDAGGYCYSYTRSLCAYPPVTVSFSDSQHGALSARSGASVLTGGDAVEKGAAVVFTATPDAGYYVSGWSGDCANVGASGSGSDSGAKTCTVTANTALTAGAVFSAISSSTGWLDWNGDIPVNHLLRTGRGEEVAHVSKEGSFSFPSLAFSRRFSPPRRQLSLRRYLEDWPILSSGGEANFSAG